MSAVGARAFHRFLDTKPSLKKVFLPLAEKYKNLAGYRQKGLLTDDLISEENDVVQKALKRLPPKVAYDRVYRLRRAMQLSLTHQILPPSEQIKPEQDIPYLRPYIEEIEDEIAERTKLEMLTKA
ncbi:14 kDa subunit of cytochrome bd ubiquinol oxidase [Ascobolus immersus RN42]|uniref:Cytochrome b-c1 complex subunit 7 n=1 Tax=Ascobolus immersus RN42 TaxID=1160509 RepID=A0A3N4I6P9_ASCIM|nr:14 kDa subunit of cytochrome bd ubiquinol oxidase [Ascobolus immersus RN42]